jgi:hypothetical protein
VLKGAGTPTEKNRASAILRCLFSSKGCATAKKQQRGVRSPYGGVASAQFLIRRAIS